MKLQKDKGGGQTGMDTSCPGTSQYTDEQMKWSLTNPWLLWCGTKSVFHADLRAWKTKGFYPSWTCCKRSSLHALCQNCCSMSNFGWRQQHPTGPVNRVLKPKQHLIPSNRNKLLNWVWRNYAPAVKLYNCLRKMLSAWKLRSWIAPNDIIRRFKEKLWWTQLLWHEISICMGTDAHTVCKTPLKWDWKCCLPKH